MKVIHLFFLSFLLYPTTLVAKDFDYVGAGGCNCHKSETKKWAKSLHAKAFDLLKVKGRKTKRNKAMKKAGLDPKKDYTEDKKCLPCHTTGYKEGGFKSIEKTPEFAGVGCESCHGPGSEYRLLHEKKKVEFTLEEGLAAGEIFTSKSTVCQDCHLSKDGPMNAKIDKKYKFVYDEKVKKTKTFHKIYPLEGKR